jgi:hypothetical protein
LSVATDGGLGVGRTRALSVDGLAGAGEVP